MPFYLLDIRSLPGAAVAGTLFLSRHRMGTKDSQNTGQDEPEISQSSERERASLLASVMKHDAERKVARASARPLGAKPLGPQLAALATSTILAVYVWFASPSWLGPDPVPLPPLAEESAAAKAAIWIGAQQVEAFAASNGRIPSSQEVGPLPPGVRYERLDARTWLLTGEGDRVAITYSSGAPQDDLLGAVRELILEGDDR